MKTEQIYIRACDNSLIGQRLVFQHHLNSLTTGVITIVTKDRVIYTDDNNEEHWSWIHSNGKAASFSVMKTDSNGKFLKAIALQKAYADLNKRYEEKCFELTRIKDLISHIKEYGNESSS